MYIEKIHKPFMLFALLVISVFLSACGAATDLGFASGNVLVLRNGSVITATGDQPIPNGVVVVEDGIITAVGPESEIEIPSGATVIDVQGRTIMPGLIDAHTHVLDPLQFKEGKLEDWRVNHDLKKALLGGLTTLRDVGSHWGNEGSMADLRAGLNEYGNTIPTLVMTGPFIAHAEDKVFNGFSSQGFGVSNVEEARDATERWIEAGADQIKILMFDDSPTALSQEQVKVIVETAHENGLLVTAHATGVKDARMVLAAGVDQLAHWPSSKGSATALTPDLISTLVETDIPVVSTFNITPPSEYDVRKFLDAGGTLAFGTDAPGTGPIEQHNREFYAMAAKGMTPMEILLAATANAARVVGLEDVVGTLETGKQADIIVLDGDPLVDVRAYQNLVYVIKNGELVVGPKDK